MLEYQLTNNCAYQYTKTFIGTTAHAWVIHPSLSQVTYTSQLGRGLFPCQQAGVKALLITILPAKKWISPLIYSGSEKLLPLGEIIKWSHFTPDTFKVSYSFWDNSRSMPLAGKHFHKLLANTSQRRFYLRSLWD